MESATQPVGGELLFHGSNQVVSHSAQVRSSVSKTPYYSSTYLSLPKTLSVNSFLFCFTNRSSLEAFDIFQKGSLVLGTAGCSIFCYFWRRSAELLSTTQVLLFESSPANTKIKQRVGTYDRDRRHEEWPRPFPGLASQLIVVPDSVYRETNAFSLDDNTWRRNSTLFANDAH